MGDEDRYKVEVLKAALVSAGEERKQLLQQVEQLKRDLERNGMGAGGGRSGGGGLCAGKEGPSWSQSHGAGGGGGGLWNVETDAHRLGGAAAGEGGSAGGVEKGGRCRATSATAAGSVRYQLGTLEAKMAALQDEVKELRSMLAERDGAVAKLQQRNGTLSATLEDREEQIVYLQTKVDRLHERLRQSDTYGPPTWISKGGGKRGGGGLGAFGVHGGGSGDGKWHEDDLKRLSLVPGSEEFEAKLRDKAATPLVGMIDSFVQALRLKNPKLSDHMMVHNFLGAMENPFRSNRLWKGCQDGALEEAMDALEKRILADEQVYSCIVVNMGQSWELLDSAFERRRFCLSFLQPCHLDIKRSHAAHPAVALSRRVLDRMDEVRAPQEKLECIFRSARLIFRMLNEAAAISNSQEASADDFLPLFIFVVLRSRLTRVHSSIEYISLFRRPPRLGGERQYYLVQLQTAVTFIQKLDHRSVTMDEAEFKASYVRREAQWDAEHGAGATAQAEGGSMEEPLISLGEP